jgi:intein/homing endonuclease
MNNKEFKMLCLFDYNCATGFATVSHNIMDRVRRRFPRMMLDIIAINYIENDKDGVAHAGKSYFLDSERRQAVHPAIQEQSNAIDPLGRHEFLRLLRLYDYSIVFVIQDPGVMAGRLDEEGKKHGDLFAEIRKIRAQKIADKRKQFKLVFYFPMDGEPLEEWFDNFDVVDVPVAYTEYGKSEIMAINETLGDRIRVIPHGINLSHFRPLADKNDFRSLYFGKNAKKTIWTNINRNQSRKDIPSTIFAFEKYKKRFDPNSFLYLHMDPVNKEQGWNLHTLLAQTFLVEGEDYMFQQKESRDISVSELNQIYNSVDFYMTTTTGEGWGLCVSPETIINTRDGFKPMREVAPSDLVMTKRGDYSKVIDKISRKDKVIKIKCKGVPAVKVTGCHPFFVIKNKGVRKKSVNDSDNPAWIKASELKTGDYVAIVLPVTCPDPGSTIDMIDYFSNDNSICFDDNYIWSKMGFASATIKGISISEIAGKYKVSKRVAEDAKNILLGKMIKGRSGKASQAFLLAEKIKASEDTVSDNQVRIKRKISVDADFMELVGVYLAQGSNDKGCRMELDINGNKTELAHRMQKIIADKFGIGSTIELKKTGNKGRIRCNSSIVAKFFGQYCGIHSHNKKIPPSLFGSKGSHLIPLIKGLVSEDGHVNKNNVYFTSTSRELVWQLRDILLAIGVFCSVSDTNRPRRPSHKPYWKLHFSIDPNNGQHSLGFFTKQTKKPGRKSAEHYIKKAGYFFVKVESIEKAGRSEVMDICVKDDHSFVGNGLLLHNTVTEAMACQVPVLAPYHTSLIDISGGQNKRFWTTSDLRFYCSRFDNMIREAVDYNTFPILMNTAVSLKNATEQKVDLAYQYARSLNWDIVVKKWIDIFERLI